MAMVVLSKSTGAGAPERNWADVKVVYDKKKTSSNPERVEKKTKIYGMSRRDPTLSGKLSSSFKDDAWTEEERRQIGSRESGGPFEPCRDGLG